MKKNIVIGMAALTLAATQATPIFAQTRPNIRTFSVNASDCIDGSDCDLVEQLRDALKNCGTRYGSIIIGSNCIQFPSVDSGNQDCNIPGNDSSNGDTESAPEHAYIRQVLELVNEERAKTGVAPLTLDTGLNNAAMVRAKEIQTSFSHTRPNGSSFSTALKEANVTYRRSGENIAWGQRTPEAVVNAWMNSAGHRANILNANFSRIGVGYLTNTSGTPYWVQLFAD